MGGICIPPRPTLVALLRWFFARRKWNSRLGLSSIERAARLRLDSILIFFTNTWIFLAPRLVSPHAGILRRSSFRSIAQNLSIEERRRGNLYERCNGPCFRSLYWTLHISRTNKKTKRKVEKELEKRTSLFLKAYDAKIWLHFSLDDIALLMLL